MASSFRASAGRSRQNSYGPRFALWMDQQGFLFIALTIDEWSVLRTFDPNFDLANDPAVVLA